MSSLRGNLDGLSAEEMEQFLAGNAVAAQVTGDSRGLGAVMAEALSFAGAGVAVTSRSLDDAQATAAETAAATSGETLGVEISADRGRGLDRPLSPTKRPGLSWRSTLMVSRPRHGHSRIGQSGGIKNEPTIRGTQRFRDGSRQRLRTPYC